MQSIYDSKLSCEVDPTRGGDEKGMAKLKTVTREVWHAIQHSAADVPSHLRVVFNKLQALVLSQWPESQAARVSVVTGFFFLRLMCPAILGPQLFGLQHHYPEGNTARTLTLVSKCIQNLANSVPFGLKEPYLVPMNSFLESNRASMAACIETLATPSAPPPPPTLEDEGTASRRTSSGSDGGAAGGVGGEQLDLGPVDRLQALATLHKILADNLGGLREHAAQSKSARVQGLIAVVEQLNGVLQAGTEPGQAPHPPATGAHPGRPARPGQPQRPSTAAGTVTTGRPPPALYVGSPEPPLANLDRDGDMLADAAPVVNIPEFEDDSEVRAQPSASPRFVRPAVELNACARLQLAGCACCAELAWLFAGCGEARRAKPPLPHPPRVPAQPRFDVPASPGVSWSLFALQSQIETEV